MSKEDQLPPEFIRLFAGDNHMLCGLQTLARQRINEMKSPYFTRVQLISLLDEYFSGIKPRGPITAPLVRLIAANPSYRPVPSQASTRYSV